MSWIQPKPLPVGWTPRDIPDVAYQLKYGPLYPTSAEVKAQVKGQTFLLPGGKYTIPFSSAFSPGVQGGGAGKNIKPLPLLPILAGGALILLL